MENYDYNNKINKKFQEDSDYRAKAIKYLDKEYQETGIYNGYNPKEQAQKDFEQMMEGNVYFTSCRENTEVKYGKKEASEKARKIKKTFAVITTAAILASATMVGGDILNHPEDYSTQHPNYDGPATFSQMIERTPDNFGLGGK